MSDLISIHYVLESFLAKCSELFLSPPKRQEENWPLITFNKFLNLFPLCCCHMVPEFIEWVLE